MARSSLRTARPTCPECGGECAMFVEKGVRGDFQVIHCVDTEVCCWYWVPDGAGLLPAVGPETIKDRIIWRSRYASGVVNERGKVIGVLAGRVAALLDDPALDQTEVIYRKVIDAAHLPHLVGIAFAIRNSRKLCGCKLERGYAWKDAAGDLREEVTPLDFNDPDNHDSCCAVGRAQRIINNALTSL